MRFVGKDELYDAIFIKLEILQIICHGRSPQYIGHVRVVAHELAHFYWDSLQNKEREEFLLAAEWRKSIDGYTASLLRKKVQIPDSYIGPHEDFTNSVELFIHDKAQLKDSPALLKCLENFIK
ncbi:MAG: hypothetical protein ACLGG0_15285 [Bacteriovoracia bacterium]